MEELKSEISVRGLGQNCEKHPWLKKTYYCAENTCCKTICIKCMFDDHNKYHHTYQLSLISEQEKSALKLETLGVFTQIDELYNDPKQILSKEKKLTREIETEKFLYQNLELELKDEFKQIFSKISTRQTEIKKALEAKLNQLPEKEKAEMKSLKLTEAFTNEIHDSLFKSQHKNTTLQPYDFLGPSKAHLPKYTSLQEPSESTEQKAKRQLQENQKHENLQKAQKIHKFETDLRHQEITTCRKELKQLLLTLRSSVKTLLEKRQMKELEVYEDKTSASSLPFTKHAILSSQSLTSYSALYLLPDSANELFVFHIPKQSVAVVQLQEQIPAFSDYAFVGEALYVAGGTFDFIAHLDLLFKILVPLFDRKIRPLPVVMQKRRAMIHPKRYHTLVAVNKFLIFSVGGYNDNGDIDLCERYSIDHDKWAMSAKLNSPRSQVAVCVLDNYLLYAFGGTFSSSVEKLNVMRESAYWKDVQVKRAYGWGRRDKAAAIQIQPGIILIFGGHDSGYKGDAFLFNVKESNISRVDLGMKKPDAFYQRKPVIYMDKVYAMGSYYKDIHAFDVKEKEWEYIPFNKWFPKPDLQLNSQFRE
jgi:hypothetical protein